MAQMAEKFLLSQFSRISLIALGLLTAYTAVSGDYLSALVCAVSAGLIWSAGTTGQSRERFPRKLVRMALLASLVVLLLTSQITGPHSLAPWLFSLPLVLLALLPLSAGAALALLFLATAIVLITGYSEFIDRHQMASAGLLTFCLCAIMVFLREYKSRQLAPLRRTDELTQAASREYLSADLHKEIQRSEREGIDMAVVMIGLDAHLSETSPDADIRSILPRIGRYLHSQLRDFDSYYRVADLQFLIILPGIASGEAARRAENIRSGLGTLLTSHGLDLTVSAGVAGLNIGDDADSLQQSAANALRRAQQQGGDRVQSYSAWNRVPPDGTQAGEALS